MFEPMFEPIVDHRDFAVFCKPPGVSVHSEAGSGFVARLQASKPGTWHLVHRLDKATSGLLVLAKSPTAAAQFGRLFELHHIDKYYLALAAGKPIKKQGLVSGDMARSRDGQWKLTRQTLKPAITQFFSTAHDPGQRLYLLRPHTGRTHQLRVAMKALGVPVLGDDRYGGGAADRLYLHAFALAFDWQGERIEVILAPKEGGQFVNIGSALARQQWLAPWTIDWPALPGPSANT